MQAWSRQWGEKPLLPQHMGTGSLFVDRLEKLIGSGWHTLGEAAAVSHFIEGFWKLPLKRPSIPALPTISLPSSLCWSANWIRSRPI
jgi:hypothetical protein